MQRILAGCAGLFLSLNGYLHAGEIICPAVTDIHRNMETADDTYSVEVRDDREWASQQLVEEVNPALLEFSGAEYVLHEPDGDEQTPTRATIICRYGQLNLTLEHLQVQEPFFSEWADNRCESLDPSVCRLINADYFNVTF
ncbi:hypothetical protein SAMN03159507_00884 [Pseudomonas sp. NFACC32-1]|uniref:DUF3757 domain-containing protein n=1 Tax=Pseudomonas TaxID=286 RepID=UPI0008762BCE|nr:MULTISPECIES: DUF3757 domain-containing protein [Pseudomonas]MDB6442290.1 DUF3757 domain-containing protein [Pseudomonas sp. 21TX0197]MDT8908625.1 DUF3757 domain-containing protein [Pseudomonas prosekii]NHN71371.1 DUF3757 domain-containing protein [Pseudomonas fluorescens]ROO41523.1 DUF3757 domain-containing protein [Pseudomonas sp. AF76]ROO42190.1 DUF3757 domain-containing protein [Pseudomonas sp. 7SR1]